MVRVSLVSQTILGLGSQVNPRFHRAVGKPPSPHQAGRPFAKTKRTSPGIKPPIRAPFDRLPISSEHLTIVGIPYDPRRATAQLPGYLIALTG
jgi:hypothetical protein